MADAQQRQKHWYDQHAKPRPLAVDDQVLVLLPSASNKLHAAWQGPYSVTRVVNDTNYEVYQPEKRKRRNIYHINLLKKWIPPDVTDTLLADVILHPNDGPDDAFHDSDGTTPGHPVPPPETWQDAYIDPDITDDQLRDLEAPLAEFSDVLTSQPGKTSVATHHIYTGDSPPIRNRPSRIPHARMAAVRAELDRMSQDGIIQPSDSAWSSPLVLVPKPDGSLRLCVDYRRLNAVSNFDAYPMPRVDDILNSLASAKLSSAPSI